MAYTSDLRDAGSDSSHKISLQVNGSTSTGRFPYLPGNEYYPNRGDIWKLHLTDFFGFTGCITKSDIDHISVLQGSVDGWNIESIVTFAVVSEYWELTSADFNVFQWLDGDFKEERGEFTLSLVTSSGKCICFQYSYVHTQLESSVRTMIGSSSQIFVFFNCNCNKNVKGSY